MTLLWNLLLVCAFIGFVISGGLLFNKSHKSYFYLGVFVLVFAIETLDFLYLTSKLPDLYPNVYMLFYPICLLAGPVLLMHLTYLISDIQILLRTKLWHFTPFILFTGFTAYLFGYSGIERIKFTDSIYASVIQPLNYVKAIHVLFYAVLIIRLFIKNRLLLKSEKKQYFFILTLIYSITAVSVTVLTALMVSYSYFMIYFISTAAISLFAGYILYFKPHLLTQIRKKYSNTNLAKEFKLKTLVKMHAFFDESENLLNPKIDLQDLSKAIGEKKHHISQVLSDEMNSNFNDFVNKKRIDYAKLLLTNPRKAHLKILAIALESGFTNKSTFYRSFVKFSNCTPSEYKNKKGSQIIK